MASILGKPGGPGQFPTHDLSTVRGALHGVFEGLFENLRFQRLLAQEPMKFANLVLQSPIIRSRHDLFPTAGRGQAALRHQPTPVNNWFGATPCRRATRLTVIPGSKVSSTMRTFSGAVQRRRR